PRTFFSRPAELLDRSTHSPATHAFSVGLLPHRTLLLQGGVGIRLQLGQHLPFLSSLLDGPLASPQRHAKELHHLSSGMTLVHGSQHSFSYILQVRSHRRWLLLVFFSVDMLPDGWVSIRCVLCLAGRSGWSCPPHVPCLPFGLFPLPAVRVSRRG